MSEPTPAVGAERAAGVRTRLLVVDDDVAIAESLAERFEARGYRVRSVGSGADAVAGAGEVDVMLLDLQLPGGDGLWVLERLAEEELAPTVVVITAHGTVGRAVEAMKRGAYDFLEKPFDPKRLEETVARAAERTRLLAANRALVAATPTRELVFEDPAMERVAGLADRAAASSATVLLLGESGTGKEVLARRVHEASPRREGPFVAVNCAALSETLLESELFGHEAGAFTGATRRRAGKIEASHGGTLFLDEIGDTTPGFQKRLLRVLQEHRFERVGGDRSIEVDLRCIAATNRDLKAMVEAGTFREDLYYRLNVIALELPPLRARRGDVRRLAEHFCAHFAIALGRPGLSLGGAAHAALAAHDWPGNVRELRNVLERAAVLAEGTEITPLDLPPELCATLDGGASEHGGPSDSAGPCAGFHAQVEAFRKRLLADTLAAHDGHQTRAAESLGLQRSYFARLLKKYDLKD